MNITYDKQISISSQRSWSDQTTLLSEIVFLSTTTASFQEDDDFFWIISREGERIQYVKKKSIIRWRLTLEGCLTRFVSPKII